MSDHDDDTVFAETEPWVWCDNCALLSNTTVTVRDYGDICETCRTADPTPDEVDTSGASAGEISERMARVQRELKR